MRKRLAELADINPPLPASALLGHETEVSFVPMGDVSEDGRWSFRRTAKVRDLKAGFTPFAEGDVLFAKITPCMENGKGAHASGLVNAVGFGSTEFHVLRPRATAAPRFLFHLSQHRELRLKAEASMIGSAGQKRVPASFLAAYEVFAPALRDQLVIAHILDTLDTQIEKTQALIAKLEQVKEGLLHDLLTRGVDENGELRPSPEAAPELYKESELGLIPRDWDASYFWQVTDLQVGYAFKSEWFREEGTHRLLRGENVGYGTTDWAATKYVSAAVACGFSEYELKESDVIIGMDRTFTKSGVKVTMVQSSDLPSLLVQRVGRFVPIRCGQQFLRLVLSWRFFQAKLRVEEKGMDIPHLSSSEILSPQIPLPGRDEQQRITEAMDPLEQRIASEFNNLAKLGIFRIGLMDDLLTGRVRVTPLLENEAAEAS